MTTKYTWMVNDPATWYEDGLAAFNAYDHAVPAAAGLHRVNAQWNSGTSSVGASHVGDDTHAWFDLADSGGTVTQQDVSLSLRTTTLNNLARRAKFTISLSKPSTSAVTVNYTTVPSSAQAVKDFTPITGSVVFAPGQTSKTVVIPVRSNDAINIPPETVEYRIIAPAGSDYGQPWSSTIQGAISGYTVARGFSSNSVATDSPGFALGRLPHIGEIFGISIMGVTSFGYGYGLMLRQYFKLKLTAAINGVITQDEAVCLLTVVGVERLSLGWSATDKSARITLSTDYLTSYSAPSDNAWRTARAGTGKSSGKRYWEVVVGAGFNTGDRANMAVGIASAALNLQVDPIFGAPGGISAVIRHNGQYGVNGVLGGSSNAWVLSSGAHVLRFLADLDNRTLAMAVDGGTLDVLNTYGGPAGTAMFPISSMNTAIAQASGHTLRTLAEDFSYAIPAGAVAWET